MVDHSKIFFPVICLTLVFSNASAAEPTCFRQDYANPDIEPDYDCPGPGEEGLVPNISLLDSVGLEKGKPAPWDGVLMDKNRVLILGLRIKGLRRLRYIDYHACKQKMKLEMDFLTASHKAETDLLKSQLESYREQLAGAKKELSVSRAWYRSWAFGLVVGFGISVAGTVALLVAIH